MATWAFYSDTAMTSQLTALTLTATGSSYVVYLGSATTGRKIVSTTTGGQLSLIPTDTTTGSGHETTAMRMSLTTGGLGSATWGASLNIGTYVNGGAYPTNGSRIYVQLRDEVGDGVYDGSSLSIVLSSAKEQAVT